MVAVTVETRTSFYGYHARAQPFLRVALYNPWLKTRLAALFLEAGHCLQLGP